MNYGTNTNKKIQPTTVRLTLSELERGMKAALAQGLLANFCLFWKTIMGCLELSYNVKVKATQFELC